MHRNTNKESQSLKKSRVVKTVFDKDFSEKNPFYYEALRNLNTIENNENGIDVDHFIDGVGKVIVHYENEDWKAIFNLYIKSGKKKFIDYDLLKTVIKDLGYKVSDEEILEIFQKIVNDKANIDMTNFIEIMNIVEHSGKR